MAMSSRRLRRNTAARTRQRLPSIEQLEPRVCLAAVSIVGQPVVDETAGTAQFVVQLSQQDSRPVTVGYSLQSPPASATYGSDYRLFLGRSQLRPTGTMTFRPGQTQQVITMRVVDDLHREGDESFTISLQRPRNATLNAGANKLEVTIRDNDNYTASIVGPVNLSAGTTFDYTLQLSSPATRRETFYVSTRSGTARVTEDYRPLTRVPVTILPGQSSALVRLVTVPDAAPDYDRIVFLDVVPATPGFPSPTPFQVTIRGVLGPIPPDVSIDDVSVTEGAAGTSTTANFVITLATSSSQPVSVNYATADGTATVADNDYVATAGTLVFSPGETSKLVSVTVVGDDTPEPNEVFELILSSPVNGILARSTATGTILNDDGTTGPAYQIDVVFPDNSLTPAQQAAFVDAAARWSEIITADLPDVSFEGRMIDDLEIVATAPFIDGPGGILGQAGPREFRQGSFLPFQGIMQFDSADVAAMVANGTFVNVILHEMGHVIGIGTLWDFLGLVQGLGTANPTYVGANAVREYQTLSGTNATGVPVENTGGPGTAGGHWRESVFNTELMTGYAEAPGVAMPISRMTVGTLEDMGYTVDYAAADPYTLNARQAALNFRRLQLNGRAIPFSRTISPASNFTTASLFAGVAFGAGTESGNAESVASRTFRALGGLRS